MNLKSEILIVHWDSICLLWSTVLIWKSYNKHFMVFTDQNTLYINCCIFFLPNEGPWSSSRRDNMTKFYGQFLWKLIIIIKPCALGQFLAKIKASVNDSNLFPLFFTFKPTLVNCKCVNEISIKHKHRYMYIICIVGSMYLLLIFNFLWKEKFDPGNEKKKSEETPIQQLRMS